MSRLRSWKQRWGITGLVSMSWLGAVLLSAIFGNLMVRNLDQNLRYRLKSPSFAHPFGTNALGIDLLGLSIRGARISVVVGLLATLVGLSGGCLVGLAAAYWRGRTDRVTLVFLDAAAAFPSFVGAVAAVLFWGKSVRNIILVIGILTIPVFARLTRAIALPMVERDFILAARMQGARHRQVLTRELVPNVFRPILGFALIAVGATIAVEGGLSYFGAGVPDKYITWGQLIAAGRAKVDRAPHVALIPAGLILFTVLALNTLSERWQAGRPLSVPSSPDDVAQPVVAVAHEQRGQLDTRDGEVVLRVENLHTYLNTPFGPVRAVDGVSVNLHRGRMLALVGESGSGKTMLARSILKLMPSPPRIEGLPGRVMFDGKDLLSIDDEELRSIRGRRIAMVFQDPMTTLDPVMRVGMQIAEPAMLHLGLSKKEALDRAADLLHEVGVPDPKRRLRAWPHELSGGLRQRVSIAIALAAKPDVLIADEPTSALDVTIQRQLLDLLSKLREERGLSVLFITHDMGIVASRADDVAVMYAGRVVEYGTTKDVFADPRMPYTRALLASIPRIDGASHTSLAAIPGIPPVPIGVRTGCAFAPRCSQAEERCFVEVPELSEGAHRDACLLNRVTVS